MIVQGKMVLQAIFVDFEIWYYVIMSKDQYFLQVSFICCSMSEH